MDIVHWIVNAKPTERSCDDVLDGTEERGIVPKQARKKAGHSKQKPKTIEQVAGPSTSQSNHKADEQNDNPKAGNPMHAQQGKQLCATGNPMHAQQGKRLCLQRVIRCTLSRGNAYVCNG